MPRRRGKNEGSIYRDKDGRWRGSVDLGYENGRRIRKLLSGRTRGEVAQKLVHALDAHGRGVGLRADRQTLGQFLSIWLEDVARRNTRPKSFRTYRYIVETHLVPKLGNVQLQKLNPQHVQRFLSAALESGLSPKSVKHFRDTLRGALNVAMKWELVHRNVAALVNPPTNAESFRPQVLNANEARQFLKAVRRFVPGDAKNSRGEHTRGHRLQALFVVAICLGLRQGEILGLRWEDLNLDAGTLTVCYQLQRVPLDPTPKKGPKSILALVAPKTAKSRRTVNLPPMVVSALRTHHDEQQQEKALAGSRWVEKGMVFSSRIGTYLEPRNLLRSFYALREMAGIPSVRFHDLRHSAATLLLSQGVHPRIVMDLLGHSSIHLTMNTYSHVIPSIQKQAADQMEAILNPVASNLASSTAPERVN